MAKKEKDKSLCSVGHCSMLAVTDGKCIYHSNMKHTVKKKSKNKV